MDFDKPAKRSLRGITTGITIELNVLVHGVQSIVHSNQNTMDYRLWAMAIDPYYGSYKKDRKLSIVTFGTSAMDTLLKNHQK